MSNFKSEIESKISEIVFSDNSKLTERASDLIIKGKDVGFSIEISGIEITEAEKVRTFATSKLQQITDIGKINIILTSSKNKNTSSKIILEQIDKVILVASGKGGVGKSTIASLLAQKLAHAGKKIGLLDADIYGPSIPTIFGTHLKPELENKRMIPIQKHNVKINSIGFITDPKTSISWRGPMVSKALYQLISLTNWGKLDYLIIDTPPGTGDIHLSLLQNYIVTGVIMVTTPQKISKIDVERSINLYKKFEIPIIGIIENMSHYLDTNSNKIINIFASTKDAQIADDNKIHMLGKIPITPMLSESCDNGDSLQNYFDLIKFDLESRF